ncbi:MAG: hypothetical protein P9E24_00885 [Candidatus Competibacter sp.]|nr:hypothetical protein [Candidatus Competibacter sp.]MDG4584841.1 hypothetical protein [Candidatus Competibacter sp.]
MTAEWLAAIAALAAVILGPFVGVYVARRQTQMTTVATSRVEWISQLRDLVAELLAEYRFVDFDTVPGQPPKVEKTTLQRLFRIETQIKLMLNPDETEHKELMRTVENAVTYAGSFAQNKLAKITEHVQAIQTTATVILKKEWGVVKAGQ